MDAESRLKLQQNWKEGPVWYFAYGSNMKASTMTNRGIEPLQVKVAQVADYYLTFDIFGIPFSEPSYASIEAFPQDGDQACPMDLFWKAKPLAKVPPVCGIAYLISPEDFHRLLATEGAGVVYELVETQATILNGDSAKTERIVVYTLKAKRPMRPNGCPSLRYMGLFRDGAEAMALPPSYIGYLETIPAYTKQAPLGSEIFTYLWRPMLKQVVKLTKWNVDDNGNCPGWVASLIIFLYESMWVYHDHVHRKVFAGGDGGKLEFRIGNDKSL